MDLRFVFEIVSLPVCILVASLVLANAMTEEGAAAPGGTAVVVARAY